jgi:hypothetical protein
MSSIRAEAPERPGEVEPAALKTTVDSRPVERRRHLRLRCEGKAEVRTAGSPVVSWGTVTDLSAGGCYIETASPLPAGRRVGLNLTVLDIALRLHGKVVVSHPMIGMGIMFETPTPEKLGEAVSLLTVDAVNSASSAAALAPVAAATPGPPPSGSSTFSVSPEVACSLLVDVIRHFSHQAVLTRGDLLRILQQKAASAVAASQ